ncbi:SLBB domain-containing protein [Vibrio salinus]|uniref:SLBB domain-containing protein n=1 Tax=Vibrio salinus TaxID=2899784 RepID=UPI001E6386D7|nr:SLBB domain-containing protein [Vibrio salinus]MCE0493809.1 SLBB domain-containing protein [Vibrio salinus]
MLKKYSILLLASILATPCSFAAQTPTQEQIKMFQSLPKAQQQALAQQYGVTLPSSGNKNSQPISTPETQKPREENALSQDENSHGNVSQQQTPTQLKRFGVSLFASSPSTFAPVSDTPIPSNYQIGPGDEIVVQLFGKDNDEYHLIVNRHGVINFPSLGPISVSGMSFTQVKSSLTKRINEQIIGVKSDITLGKLRTMQIFVMGDAYKPGAYTVSALTTISQAIYYSGGFSNSGSLRNIQLKRNGKIVRKLDLYDLLLKGDSSNDVRLLPGDVVFVNPVGKTATVEGAVNRPAIYELRTGETFRELLHDAGDMTSTAYTEQIRVTRLTPEGERQVLTINSSTADMKKLVSRGDIISVGSANGDYKDYIKVDGDVVNPGYQQWTKGQRISDVFYSLDSAFNPTADVNYALVIREINPQHNIRVLQFSLANALLHPDSDDNLTLHSRDQILIFNRFGEDDLKRMTDNKNVDDVTAKSLHQAQKQAQFDKQQQAKIASGGETLDTSGITTKQVDWLFQGKHISKEQVQDLKNNSRRVLMAQVILKLRQQAIYGSPAQLVEVRGEVKHPGLYPITQRNHVKDIINAAGGLTEYAYTHNAEIARTLIHNQRSHINIISFNLNNALLGDAQANLIIAPRDKINILQQPGLKEQNTVDLRGEVKFPGIYTISKGETLRDVIKRAGGLTQYAYPQGAIFTRESLRLKEEKLLKHYAEDLRSEVAKKSLTAGNNSSVLSDPDKTLSFIDKAAKSKALGRLVIQLDQIEKGNLRADVPLEDGDFLFVPTYSNTISVMGEVQVGITYLLDPRLDVDDYINKAGGMKKRADEDRVFVIRADGSVIKPNNGFWFGRSYDSLVAGDTIVVPVDSDYRDTLSFWQAATQILYQTGVAINALDLN